MNKTFYILCFFCLSFQSLGNVDDQKDLNNLQLQFREIMKENTPTYVVATASPFFSFDPLSGDSARNKDTMRMLYATPLEMDAEGQYTSTVLEKFYFDAKSNKVVFKIKDSILFDDGSIMTIDDIALSIKRMALKHPKFPVIKNIKGIAAWIRSKTPLTTYPEGLKVDKEKGILEIHLMEFEAAPLFRFSLELFSIIPTSCIDLITSSLKCKIPPFSGRYKLGDNIITNLKKKAEYPVFIKFESRVSGVPQHMWIAFMSPLRIVEYLNDFNDVTVIKSNEIDIPNFQKVTLLKKLQAYFGPKVLYSVVTLNPASKTFKDKRVRQYFAMKYREATKDYGFEPEGSIFTNLLIGYIPLFELNKMVPSFTKKEEAEILNHLKKNPPIFLKNNSTNLHPFTYILSTTLKKLGLPEVHPLKEGDFESLWKRGTLSIRPATCGFWPIDPTGDIGMVFTPGFHPFVVLDKNILNLMSKLKHKDKKSHIDFNRYIFEDSKMVITTNYSRVYFMSKKASLFIPYGISGPYPWIIFKSDK